MLGGVTASDSVSGGLAAPQLGTPAGKPIRTAAFFDLDKTVIAKSSTLAFSKPFFDQGLINRRAVLKSTYAQFLFLMSGADHDQMDRMRSYVTNMCTGWDVEQVKSIVGETLHDIVDPLVFAEAANLIADHKLCGRDVVVVSASGEEIVGPIAKALGATHAMATRMVVEDGKYTGEVAYYCFGEGKVEAIRALAAREGYALEHCYAYSDSITDLPMLEAVGHPTVVNPDRGLRKEWYAIAVFVHIAGIVYLAWHVVRDVREPWRDPVRADGLDDDPAGGVLDGAPDRGAQPIDRKTVPA